MRIKTVLVGLAAASSMGALAAPALAESNATCRLEAHVKLTPEMGPPHWSGTFESDGISELRCVGTLAGSTVTDGGRFAVSGTYGSAGAHSCPIGFGTARFAGGVPRLIAFFRPQHIALDGAWSFTRVGAAMPLKGEGYADHDTISYTGAADLVPDAGQDCVARPLRSGTLTVVVKISDAPARPEPSQPASAPEQEASQSQAAEQKSSSRKAARKGRRSCGRRKGSARRTGSRQSSRRHGSRGRRCKRRSS